MWDVQDAYEGYALSKGIKETAQTSLTPGDVRELRRMMDEYGNA